jgi:hypothetical protein
MNKKILPYVIFGVPAIIGLYFVYKAIKNSKKKGQDAPPNYNPNDNSNVDPKPNGGSTPSVAKLFPLKKGSKGGKVIELQRAMLVYDDTILGKFRDDGDFGSTTEKALQTILGKSSADSQDDIDAIVKKANEKKQNQATKTQVDNTNNNRLALANKLIAEYKKDPSSKDFSAIVDTAVYEGVKTSDGRVKDAKNLIYRKNEKIPLSRQAIVKTGTTTGGLVGFIVADDPYNNKYYSFSPYAFEVK